VATSFGLSGFGGDSTNVSRPVRSAGSLVAFLRTAAMLVGIPLAPFGGPEAGKDSVVLVLALPVGAAVDTACKPAIPLGRF
jgi:hypothetical protein